MSKWQWKEKDGSTGGLLYEPGNWGDILKGEWLLRVLAFLTGGTGSVTEAQGGAFFGGYLDPFAGMPDYPVSRACQERISGLPPELLLPAAVSTYLGRARWPGSCALAADFFAARNSGVVKAVAVAADSAGAGCEVYDLDERRRGLLAADARFRVLSANSGWDLLPPPADFGLVLVDPYDVLAEWQTMLPQILSTARRMPVLLYIYNRSGRGKAQLQEYRKFRSALRAADCPALWGRVAADAFLPDCWHEMVFFPSSAEHWEGDFTRGLREATEAVERAIQAAGRFGIL